MYLLTACSAPGPTEQDPAGGNSTQETTTSTSEPEANATGLDIPWAINKSGDGFYISERPGTVAFVNAAGKLTRQEVKFADPLATVPEAGFLGFVLKMILPIRKKRMAIMFMKKMGNR
ncbi:hypothetical protein B0H99_101166 [Planomicrobium soli]|uniref:Uncharacterized protein n=1 Tax=Planomicrobium soli TaxID=1176648 RepID=A0A2P8H6U8_9BACL|nr:hypothetical protein B0H99_101166 [Planomicrobium soli]